MDANEGLFVGVDVGTGSARAALVNDHGKILKVATSAIKTWKDPIPKHFEQSSDDIWNVCKKIIKEVTLGINSEKIKGIGFDATCSLVAISKTLKPISISFSGNNEQNIILWMDHRAKEEAEFINSTRHTILKYVGGKVSLEMQMPKILWIKKHLPHIWEDIGYLFDLPDYLTWKATGDDSRSLCSLVCKWNYVADIDGKLGWDDQFLRSIGLEDLTAEKIGQKVLQPGSACGAGLSERSAFELGLLPGTAVGTSIIDAHAGGLGMIGCSANNISTDFDSRLSLICGTSTCHMAVSLSPFFVPGVWGPYKGAMVPGYWLNEAGQSASGLLVDHIINTHPAANSVKAKCSGKMHIQEYLNILLKELAVENKLNDPCFLTKDLHVLPDFHGNRSPLADSNMLGMISGLTISSDEKSLALLYLATLQALSYGTRHIMDALKIEYHNEFKSILVCGGLAKNPLFVQTQADAVNLPLLLPKESESVLLGAAILGACGAKYFSSIPEAIQKMGGEATIWHPNEDAVSYCVHVAKCVKLSLLSPFSGHVSSPVLKMKTISSLKAQHIKPHVMYARKPEQIRRNMYHPDNFKKYL